MQPITPALTAAEIPELLKSRQSPLPLRACMNLLVMLEEGYGAEDVVTRMLMEQEAVSRSLMAELKFDAAGYVKGNYTRAVSLLLGTNVHDRVMAMAAVGKVRIDYFADANRQSYERSFVRKQDGSLFTNAELKRLVRERSSIDALLLSVAKCNDTQGYEQLIKIKPVAARASIQMIMETASRNQVTVPAEFVASISKGKPKEPLNVNTYVGAFKGATQPNLLNDLLKEMYDATLIPVVGHELFHGLFSSPGYFEHPVRDGYVQQLVKDGADWYVGLMQAVEGSHVYLGLVARNPDRVKELEALIEFGGKKSHKAMVAQMLKVLPEEVILAYADTQAKANKVFKIERLECIKNRVSKALHERNFEEDLGL